jgi:hypothetical protein
MPSSELFTVHLTPQPEVSQAASGGGKPLAIIIIDTLSASLSQSQAPDVVECAIFTLADICSRMRSHAASAAADVMAAVALSRGGGRQGGSEAGGEAVQAYGSFRQSLDGEILKDMLLPHMRSLHKTVSEVLLAIADVCWGLVGNSNGGFVTQACNLLRDVLSASSSLAAAATAAAAAAAATPSIFDTSNGESKSGAFDAEDDDLDAGGSAGDDAACGDDAFASHADAFLQRALSMPPGRKGRYIALQVLLEVFPGNQRIARECRAAFEVEAFRMSDFSTAATLGRLLLLLLSAEASTLPQDEHLEQQQQQQLDAPWWCNVIIRSLVSSSYTCRLNLANRVLPDLFADNMAYFHTFMRSMPSVVASLSADGTIPSDDAFERVAFAKLSACVAVRDAAPNRPGCDSWKGYVDSSYIMTCVKCGDSDVVLRAFNLLCLKAAAAAVYTHADIAAIQSSVIHNSKSALPSFVGAATETFKKFLVRACALGNSAGRGGKLGGNSRSRKGNTGENHEPEDDAHSSPYVAMCQWLGQFVPASCYPGVAYERSYFVLSLLLAAMDVIDPFVGSSRSSCGAADKKLSALSTPEQAQRLASMIFNRNTLYALFNLLTDSHDAAREKAYTILMRVRSSAGVLDSPDDIKALSDWATSMCASLRVREADAGARALAALHHMCSSSAASATLVPVILHCVARGCGAGQLPADHTAVEACSRGDDGCNGSLEFMKVLEVRIRQESSGGGIAALQGTITLASLVISSANFSAIVSRNESNSSSSDFSLWQQVLNQLAVDISRIIKSSLVKLSTGIHAPPQPEAFSGQGQSEESEAGGLTANMFGGEGEEEGDGVATEDVEIISR